MLKLRFGHIFAILSTCILPTAAMAQTVPEKPSDAPLENSALVVQHPNVQDIYLLIGQSNMGGRAAIGDLDKVLLKKVFLFNRENHWEKAANLPSGMNRYSTVRRKISMQNLNPAYTFGRKLANYTGRKIGIVSNARGGTSIASWQKGYTGKNDADMYEEAVARSKAALAASPKATLKGIIWHQGEGDNSAAKAAVYMQQLQRLVSDLRVDLNVPDVTFVAGEVGTWRGRGSRVNPVIDRISTHISHSNFVSSQGLTSLNLPKNDPHFDTLSQRVLGERYADVILRMVYSISPGAVTLFNQPNFAGRSIVLRPGKYEATDLEKRGLLLRELASLKLQEGYKVLLRTDDSRKKKVYITQNASDISIVAAGKTIESIVITKAQ